MIITSEKKDVQVGGDFQTQQFSILASAKAFDILTSKIYTNKVKAVIREISTNAWDSHQDAGNPDPFDVHLPTSLEPWFSVRDYGTGISPEQMMTLYTEFFRSTRTESNDFCGALGIGRVAPLSMADSFVVTSWFNGQKRVYSAYKDENDCPQFALLATDDSDEPNGVEVSVAVSTDQVYEFTEEAVDVYKFFDNIPNINIREVADRASSAFDHFNIRTNDFATSTKWGNINCVMGNVGYSVSYKDIEHPFNDMELNLYFNIGELSFTPGRESLSFDKKTKEAVIAKLDLLKEKVSEVVQQQINDCKNYYEAKCLYDSINRKFKDDCTYNGQVLKFAPEFKNAAKCYYTEGYTKTSKNMDVTHGYYDDKTEYYWNKKGYTGRIRQHLKSFNYRDNRRVILVEAEHLADIGIDSSYVKNLEDLPKVEYSYGVGTVNTCKIYTWDGRDCYSASDCWNESEVDLNDGEERVYVEINRYKVTGHKWFVNDTYQIKHTLESVNQYIGDVKVYGVKSVLLKSKGFQNGNWIRLEDYLKREMMKVAPKTVSNFTGVKQMADLFCALADKVTDEKFADFRDLYKTRDNYSLVKILQDLGIEVSESDEINNLYQKILDNHQIFDIINVSSACCNLDKVAKYVQ
jgi:hypothetical protein